jgi:hypothetical protein
MNTSSQKNRTHNLQLFLREHSVFKRNLVISPRFMTDRLYLRREVYMDICQKRQAIIVYVRRIQNSIMVLTKA